MYTSGGDQTATAAIIATNPHYTYSRWTDAEFASASWLHDHHEVTAIYQNDFYWWLIANFDLPLTNRVFADQTVVPSPTYIFMGAPPNFDYSFKDLTNETLLTKTAQHRSRSLPAVMSAYTIKFVF